MKRIIATGLAMLALTACGSLLANPQTPQQALTAAVQRSAQLHSAKFDLQGHVNLTFPPQLAQMFGQSGVSSGSLALDLTGTGAAQFPDRYHAVLNARLSGISVATEVIVVAGQAYVKNPLTGKWELSTQSAGLTGGLDQPDPLSYAQLLSNVKSVQDLGDTSLNGTAVHHYRLVPDKDKLIASLSHSTVKNPQALAAITQVLNGGTMTIDVWFGKDDHLVRRLSTDADYHLDLTQLMSTLGAPAGSSGARLPSGSAIHAMAHVIIDYHDFDAPVTISIPTVS